MENERKAIIEHLNSKECKTLLETVSKTDMQILKSCEQSIISRRKAEFMLGRDKHNVDVHDLIWKLIVKSIAKAPMDSEELALAYASRSKFLFHLKKYKDCIKDIDRALKITKNDSLKVELLCRKTESSVASCMGVERNAYEKAKYLLNKIEDDNESKEKLAKIVEKAEIVLERCQSDIQEKEKREKMFSMSSLVNINWNEKFGRHLVAARDLQPGEVVCVEKFYVASSNPQGIHTYCSYCLNSVWILIPCDYCDLNMYCSENCKTKAWEKYHDIECSVFVYIVQFSEFIDGAVCLGLKVLIMALKETGSIEKLKEETMNIDSCIDNCTRGMKDGKFRSNTFRSIYSLSNPCQFNKLDYLISRCTNTLIALAKFSKIFGNDFSLIDGTDLAKNEDAVFIGALMLKFSSIASVNAIEFVEATTRVLTENHTLHFKRNSSAFRGQILAPLCSLMNHSCNPNVNRVCTDDGKVIFYCLLPIKKDEQIFSNYCPPFYSTLVKSERRKYLMDTYQFRCYCKACEENWTSSPRHSDDRIENLGIPISSRKKNSMLKSILLKLGGYVYVITNQDIELKSTIITLIGDDIEKLLRYMEFPHPEIISFIYLLRLAYENTYGNIKISVPEECQTI